jgi:hypothetical protein
MGLFGWDLPPGCSVSDIPGNRPEDSEMEALEERFYKENNTEPEWEEFNALNNKSKNDLLLNIVSKAITFGIEIGNEQARKIAGENAYYEAQERDYENDKALEAWLRDPLTIEFNAR